MSGFLEPKYKDIRDNSGFLHSNMYSKPFHPFFSHTELFPLPSPNLSIMLHTVHLKFFDSRKDEEIRILRLFRFLFLTEQRRFKLWVFQIIARANFLMSTTWGNKATEGERINKHFYTKKKTLRHQSESKHWHNSVNPGWAYRPEMLLCDFTLPIILCILASNYFLI